MPYPSLGDFLKPGIEPSSPALQADSLPLSLQGSPDNSLIYCLFTQVVVTISFASKSHCKPFLSLIYIAVCADFIHFLQVAFPQSFHFFDLLSDADDSVELGAFLLVGEFAFVLTSNVSLKLVNFPSKQKKLPCR